MINILDNLRVVFDPSGELFNILAGCDNVADSLVRFAATHDIEASVVMKMMENVETSRPPILTRTYVNPHGAAAAASSTERTSLFHGGAYLRTEKFLRQWFPEIE